MNISNCSELKKDGNHKRLESWFRVYTLNWHISTEPPVHRRAVFGSADLRAPMPT